MPLSCVCAFAGALAKRSACPYMYRWVDVFARPVPVYALVDGYVGVCVHLCVYVYMHLCMNMLLLLYMYVCIYPYIYAPEQKIEIENRDHP